jgi:hypothetical protein
VLYVVCSTQHTAQTAPKNDSEHVMHIQNYNRKRKPIKEMQRFSKQYKHLMMANAGRNM